MNVPAEAAPAASAQDPPIDVEQADPVEPVAVALVPATPETINVDLALSEKSEVKFNVHEEIAKDRAKTENFFLKATIFAVCASPIVIFLAIFWMPDQSSSVVDVFERWLSVLGPLLGAAFGAGAFNRSESRDSH